MVRGKVVLKRIENKINRQVTFSKRRQGLFKKAQELSVLCDAQVAVIVSSSRGKLFDFASPDDVKQILERYHQCCTPQRNDTENEKQSLCEEVLRLKVKYESLQRSQRHFLGEDLEKLRLKELNNLEKQLDRNLSRARQRKTQMMIDQLEALRRKENDLTEMNKKITSELEEREKHGGDHDEEEAVIQGRPGGGGPGSTNIATANADPSGSQQEPTLHL